MAGGEQSIRNSSLGGWGSSGYARWTPCEQDVTHNILHKNTVRVLARGQNFCCGPEVRLGRTLSLHPVRTPLPPCVRPGASLDKERRHVALVLLYHEGGDDGQRVRHVDVVGPHDDAQEGLQLRLLAPGATQQLLLLGCPVGDTVNIHSPLPSLSQ